MSTRYFDSHCHLTAEQFAHDREDVIARARAAGVDRIVTIASDLADARDALALARNHDGVWCTAGIHPHEAAAQKVGDLEEIRSLLSEEPLAVAVGETGLDYYYDHSPRREQIASLEAHVSLALETDKPLVVHCREADDDLGDILLDAGDKVRGVLHCFVGGARLLETGLALGWYVSYSGIASFKNFDGGDLLRTVPLDRLLIETDAPYLAPVPRRGRRNEPSFVPHVCAAVAGILDVDPARLAEVTVGNALRFYGLEELSA
jgi:TatD DNase family protein